MGQKTRPLLVYLQGLFLLVPRHQQMSLRRSLGYLAEDAWQGCMACNAGLRGLNVN
jgi:hypothetical protein